MNLTIDLPLLIGLTIGLTEVIKRVGQLNEETGKRFIPLFALIVGIGLTTFRFGFAYESVITGFVIGLSASGLFSGSKAVVGK